jgi:hypothetical protein
MICPKCHCDLLKEFPDNPKFVKCNRCGFTDLNEEEKKRKKLREKYGDLENQTQPARLYRLFLIRPLMRTEELKQAGMDLVPKITAADQVVRQTLVKEGLVKKYYKNGSKTKTWELVR